MNPTLYDPSASIGASIATSARRPPALTVPVARAVLGAAILLGAAADALMHDGITGVGLAIWVALVCLNGIVLRWRAERAVSPETAAWLAGSLAFAIATVWRNAEALQGFDVLATVFCLGMAALSTRDPRAALFARRIRETFFTAVDVIRGVAFGVLPLAFREAGLNEPGHTAAGRLRVIIRPAVIACAALLVFGSLLRSADPIFASIVTLPSIDFGETMSHVVMAGFFAWIVAGWARASLSRDAQAHRASAIPAIELASADVTAALGTLIVLFAAFIATQIGWFFGGEEFLRARTGLTAATYARKGFFQMVWVVTLVIPVLVGTRAALRPDRALARRHTLLSIPIVLLLGVMIASAMLRLKMYVHFYGLTTDRFYPMVFMLWLAIVLAWFAATVLRGWGRPFAGGAVLSGLGTLVALNIVDPDAIVARVNISRAENLAPAVAGSLDVIHLASLGGDGALLATKTVLDQSAATAVNAADRCMAARVLLSRWSPESRLGRRASKHGAWRYWNRDDAAALQLVRERRDALSALAQTGCADPNSH